MAKGKITDTTQENETIFLSLSAKATKPNRIVIKNSTAFATISQPEHLTGLSMNQL